MSTTDGGGCTKSAKIQTGGMRVAKERARVNGIRVIPTEDEEQQFICSWAALMESRYPELKLLYHIPNEGRRSGREGARLKRMGLRRGAADLCLPVARGKWHGLYIELKALDGRATDEQKQFISDVSAQGYLGRICFGADEAIKLIERYITGEV